MSNIEFSVVIPLFNKEKYIRQTIESVHAQTYQDFEIIVVNDGSTDRSENIVSTLLSKKLIYIHISNSGVANARNVGIRKARGKYIAFLDADDIWEKDYLKNIKMLIDGNPGCGFYCTKYQVVRKNKIELSSNISTSGYIGSFWELLRYRYDIVWTSATVIAREYLISAGLFNTIDEVGEDLSLWVRVAKLNPKVSYSSKSSVNYIRDTENNARLRTKILYPSEFLNEIGRELVNGKHTVQELDSMQYKYDKKMYVYILSLIVNEKKAEAIEELKKWENKNFALIKVLLTVMISMPDKLNRLLYEEVRKRT